MVQNLVLAGTVVFSCQGADGQTQKPYWPSLFIHVWIILRLTVFVNPLTVFFVLFFNIFSCRYTVDFSSVSVLSLNLKGGIEYASE